MSLKRLGLYLLTVVAVAAALVLIKWNSIRREHESAQQRQRGEPSKTTSQPAVLAQESGDAQPITRDLSSGAIFKFKIAPNLPEFTFRVIPEPQTPDEHGNPQTTVREVQVFSGDSAQPMQTLEDCEFAGMEAPPSSSDWFSAEDMNFDGYKDIFLLTNWGATGNQSGCVWLYDSETGRFEFDKDFTALGSFQVDPATKTLTTHGNGGMAGTIFRAAKYVIEDNHPVPITAVTQDYDSTSKKYHCVMQQRRGGKFVTIRDVWAEPKGDFDYPCDPSDPFRDVGDK